MAENSHKTKERLESIAMDIKKIFVVSPHEVVGVPNLEEHEVRLLRDDYLIDYKISTVFDSGRKRYIIYVTNKNGKENKNEKGK